MITLISFLSIVYHFTVSYEISLQLVSNKLFSFFFHCYVSKRRLSEKSFINIIWK